MAAYMWNSVLRNTSRMLLQVDSAHLLKTSLPCSSRLGQLLQCNPCFHREYNTALLKAAQHRRLQCASSQCNWSHSPLPSATVWQTSQRALSTVADQEVSQGTSVQEKTEEPDKLYKTVELRVKGHDDAVLDSYEMFVCLAAKELGVTVESVAKPLRKIKRMTLLKSRHIFKKHRVQYEFRTYFRIIELKHLTGSTADVFLEYIERNLPEGVALKVTKTALEKMPSHLQSPPQEDSLESSSSSASSSSSSSSDEDENPTQARD